MPIPKVSIITAVFNGAKTIQRTIDSVFGQSYQDFQWVIVDGGSTDGTIDILRKIPSDKVLWQSGPDNGIYDAMNKGIALASGEWFFFLGADDTFYDADVLHTIFSQTDRVEDFIYGDVFDLKLGRRYDGPFDYDQLLVRNICHQSIFFRRSLFDHLGLYNTRFRLMADWDFNLRCFNDRQLKIHYLPVTVAYYTEGGASAAYNDVDFFRESLFTYRYESLQRKGLKQLRSLSDYDRWWRLFRSMRFSKDEDAATVLARPLPRVFLNMVRLQKGFPFSALKKGVVSKSLMLWSYCCNRLQGRL